MRKCFRLPHFKIKVAMHSDSCYNIRIKERKETWLVSSESVVKYFLPNTEKFVIIIVQNQKGVGFSSTGAKKLQPKVSYRAGDYQGGSWNRQPALCWRRVSILQVGATPKCNQALGANDLFDFNGCFEQYGELQRAVTPWSLVACRFESYNIHQFLEVLSSMVSSGGCNPLTSTFIGSNPITSTNLIGTQCNGNMQVSKTLRSRFESQRFCQFYRPLT